MDKFTSRSGMLMTRGVMKMKSNPVSFVCSVRTFRHPTTRVAVTLNPVPNIAARAFFRTMLEELHVNPVHDKILVEDGRLPFVEGTADARKQQMRRIMFPMFSSRPIASTSSSALFDGLVSRDPVESRMAWMSVTESLTPGVDPRARRAIERIESYPDGTRVVCPWNIYHLVYMSDKLTDLGYELIEDKEVVVITQTQIVGLVVMMFAMAVLMGITTMRILFGL